MSVKSRKPTTHLELDGQNQQPSTTVSSRAEVAPPLPANKINKEPPPEKATDVRRRTYVILSFWALILSLGLPIWWHTTSVYRASLPLDEMMNWADGRACRPTFPLTIAIEKGTMRQDETEVLIQMTQMVLDGLSESPDSSDQQLRLTIANEASIDDENIALTVRLNPGDTTTTALQPEQPILQVTYAANTLPSPDLASRIARDVHAVFSEEQAVISTLVAEASGSAKPSLSGVNPAVAAAVAKRSTRSLKYAPTYHLTFSLFTAGASPSSWDIDAAVEQYMRPVLDVLSPIHNFTIDTQVQLYAAPGVQSDVLSKDDLSSFINAAEWPLSPSIGGAPTINFVVFVGNQSISLPTAEAGSDATATAQSWLIPQWGSVYLVPHTSETANKVPAQSLRAPMATFTAHLLSLLGTPETSGSLPLRLAGLRRIRSADLVLRASSSLGSLARLSRALPGIAIPRSVADGVSTTLRHLRQACDALGTSAGLAHARIAQVAADKAFFEKSMVGQLYFPDEHKVAVYLPLLGPVGVPLIMGLLNELKAWKKRRQEKAAAEKTGKKTE
ncbi:hypothetical protein MCOR25_006406 [Pyricularia grisea]|uniref:GPI transamidase component PIG-S-like protein n=1 Tax=Pyricularia grisea TaxID=148305 RepID=A0A6P8B2L3_PYRGI|nr:uncharacterized protein PgNI_07839 [Pyricularia grisea]KAI6361787.1 hypothetical protein MCOR25_006406 [Pyricularia grisea]TLD08948.1 hypothetical protein PgNI_07839 [Pyricularia grisea]